MFTGIVTAIGRVTAVEDRTDQRRLTIACDYDPATIAIGASIACGGPCLTVVETGGVAGDMWFRVDVAAETLARTTVGAWGEGTRVNLERSLKIGDELGGHIVTGHVDGLAEIVSRSAVTAEESGWGATARFDLRLPAALSRFVAEKGSVALDGCSLTVNAVEGDVFSVLLIPHTLEITTFGERRAGDRVNVEIDLMARYAARLMERR
ncbi:riboflavin synthase [Salinarimonas ramus]|uniref:Riboflavin synthase n=1 Tax=Salinarimonas ramus TaxID=690164 RepID=A0A917V728_9HYPH|nr:riboflavin synthase [Salinarimonas ramus]GGK46300.1 riboflavin synthase subunit alpha [Salinarimonas ramus]